MKSLIIVIFLFAICLTSCKESEAQTPYFMKRDSVTSNAAGGDSLATLNTGRYTTFVGITATNSTTADTLKARGIWYGNTTQYKTLSWRNTKNGTIDSVLIVPATSGLPQTWELVDPYVDNIVLYRSAGTYVSTRRTHIFFRYKR